MSDAAPADELSRRLREAGAEELLALVREHLEELTAQQLQQLFRNPFVDREVISALAGHRPLLRAREVRREVVRHKATPQPLALSLVPHLFWRELLETAGDVQVPPAVRRAAERTLVVRLPAMAVGEKISLARRASHGLLAKLRHDPSPRVFAAVLENPRLTEALLLPLVSSEAAKPQVLSTLAADRRWGVRYPLRVALCRNRRTPVRDALRLLPSLKKHDLKAVASQITLAPAVRRRASVLLGEA